MRGRGERGEEREIRMGREEGREGGKEGGREELRTGVKRYREGGGC